MAKAAVVAVGVPPSTVRGWLRRFAVVAGAVWARFTAMAHELDPLLGPVRATGGAVGDAVEAIGVAARAAALCFGPVEAWQFVASATEGRLLCNTSCP